jgi:dipeptidyl aminopeptidase/acylaminoacyl peptidase
MRPWIKNENLGKGEYVTFKARDGLEIPALITYPPGYTPDKGRIPLVVHPHGGPWARDDMGWDGSGWVQFMATRGVAVIQPQYRGSAGWGDKLWKAGDGEWGQKMQDDKDDAAQYMVNRGIADPKRMAIFGYSYGGFAAIAASVRPNSPYNCAIAGAGVSSLDRLGNLWGDGLVQREVQGKTVDGMDPLKNVGKANIPIMLYHGDRDRQADYDHSVMFARAMKEAGNDVEFHTIKDMWHTLPWRYEWHKQTLTLIENYFKSPKCKIM